MQRRAIRNLPISEVDALVRSAPLEGAVQSVDPLLVGSARARPYLEFSAEGIDSVGHVDALSGKSASWGSGRTQAGSLLSYFVAKYFYWAGCGVPAEGKGGGPILVREVFRVAVVDYDGCAVYVFACADAALDSCVGN